MLLEKNFFRKSFLMAVLLGIPFFGIMPISQVRADQTSGSSKDVREQTVNLPEGMKQIEPFSEGKALKKRKVVRVEHRGRYGLIDEKGRIVIEPKYDKIGDFDPNGFGALVWEGKNCGLVSDDGKIVIKPQFDEIFPFYLDGYAQTVLDGKYGLVKYTGEIILPPQYKNVTQFSNEDLLAVMEKDLVALFSITGKRLSDFKYTNILAFDKNGIAKIETSGKIPGNTLYGFIDRKGKEVLKPVYERLDYPDETTGWARLEKDGKIGFVKANGEFVLEPRFETLSQFNKMGLARAQENGKMGLVNRNWAYVVPAKFKYIASEKDTLGLHSAQDIKTEKWGSVNEKGDWVIAPKYNAIFIFEKNGWARVAIGEGNMQRFGIIDRTGAWVVEPHFLEIGSFDKNGKAWVSGYSKAKKKIPGVITADGKIEWGTYSDEEQVCGVYVKRDYEDQIVSPEPAELEAICAGKKQKQ